MKSAFRVFMEGLIDYAGLFPPARLDLDTSLRNYLRYLGEPEAWMLGRFVIPAGRLIELSAYQAELFGREGERFRLSVLVGGGDKEEEAHENLHGDLEKIRDFLRCSKDGVNVEALETRLPREITKATDEEKTVCFLKAFVSALRETLPMAPDVFVEVPAGENWSRTDGAAIGGIAHFGKTSSTELTSDNLPRVGFKLRCGGAESHAFPSLERVSSVIVACRDHQVPLKCTAGLHHPLRYYAEEIGEMSHGFLNIFGAGVLAYVLNLPRERIEQCLSDDRADSFSFDEEIFSWQGDQIRIEDLEQARQEFMTGFGSCSFDEPREHLRTLRLLNRPIERKAQTR